MAEVPVPELRKKPLIPKPSLKEVPEDRRYSPISNRPTDEYSRYLATKPQEPRNASKYSRSEEKAQMAAKHHDPTNPVDRELREMLRQEADKK